MNHIEKYENLKKINLPKVYKDFYKKCEESIPKEMVGTDLFNNYPELNAWAIELLEEDETEVFLDKKDFVFMMHQGYMFWYFKADGNVNPDVYIYEENSKAPKKLCSFKQFVENYPKI